LGFTSFQLAMLIGRFSGDKLVYRFGPVAMVRRGGLIASVGIAIALMIGLPVPTLLGFMAAGLGLATAYPLAMSAAGNFKFLPRGQSVASVATVGYTGFLAGPPVLGWIAHITSLTWTIGVVSLLCLLVAVFADATRDAGVGHADDPAVAAGTVPAE
jgi:MFS family permease